MPDLIGQAAAFNELHCQESLLTDDLFTVNGDHVGVIQFGQSLSLSPSLGRRDLQGQHPLQ